MDHSGMDHGGMDMPSHGPMCNMNVSCKKLNSMVCKDLIQLQMLFTWDTTNLCIIFRWWHISSNLTLVFSLFGVMLLTAGYELVRDLSRRYEASSEEYMNSLPSEFAASRRLTAEESGLRSRQDDVPESRSLLWSGRSIGEADRRAKIVKAAFYAVQVFYSFFIM